MYREGGGAFKEGAKSRKVLVLARKSWRLVTGSGDLCRYLFSPSAFYFCFVFLSPYFSFSLLIFFSLWFFLCPFLAPSSLSFTLSCSFSVSFSYHLLLTMSVGKYVFLFFCSRVSFYLRFSVGFGAKESRRKSREASWIQTQMAGVIVCELQAAHACGHASPRRTTRTRKGDARVHWRAYAHAHMHRRP